MALREPFMTKTVIGMDDLELRADVGESLLVKGINVWAAAADYITLKIEKTTVGYFRVSGTYGNHLAFSKQLNTEIYVSGRYEKNLLALLFDKGIFTGYPVAEGETFYLIGANNSTDMKTVIYEVYDAGDRKPEDPNGSKSKEYFFINYGDTGATIDSAGDKLYSRSLVPVEFPQFPYGIDVPAKTNITLHGICGKEVGVRNATPANAIYTRYLKLVREREVLFDEDRNGLLFDFSLMSGAGGTKAGGGHSVIGNYDNLDTRLPLFFPEPLVFSAGEELNIYVTIAEPVDGSTITTSYQVIGLIETVKRE